jgi:hypothetical protein
MADIKPKFTAGEAAQIAWLCARMAKRSLAGDTVYMRDLERKIERIEARALRRTEKQQKP